LIEFVFHHEKFCLFLFVFLHALYVIPIVIFKFKNNYEDTVARGRILPTIKESFQMLGTFGLFVFALTIFRSADMSQAVQYLGEIFSISLFSYPQVLPFELLVLLLVFMSMESVGREQYFAIETFYLKWPRLLRWTFHYAVVISIFYFHGKDQ